MRYALDIPYIARENSAAEILALRGMGPRHRMTAWGRAKKPVSRSNKPNGLRPEWPG